MSKYLNPKVDLTFKKIFGEHPNLVKSLLNALLPLPEGMEIVKVEHLNPENVPDNPTKKYSIVDVRCTDNKGRGFIVEMQSYWNKEFFLRTLFNAASMYTKQLAKGNPFERLKEVYALALVNDEAFNYDGDSGYMQEFYITNKNHPEDIHHDLSLIFVELVKYRPVDRGSRAIKDLWLRFLTEINEQTEKVDDVLLENPDISQALNIVERSAYTDADIYAYEDYLLEVMTQRNSVTSAMKDGIEQGRAEGRVEGMAQGKAEGAQSEKFETAKRMKAEGLELNLISKITQLPLDEIERL
ncbi:MAG: Rpn family recombination-promoting nuclease/putative transposase [Bacteroidales bacterium]|nr:Rpn family recombination-promoting nuclease/putative transposase [Bacteroidales bacterium]